MLELMGTNGTTIQLYAQSLSPQECDKHRAWIGVRVEALMDPYWDKRPSDAVKAEMMADWMDALQNYSPDEIRSACRDYLKGPRNEYKPKTGDIVWILDRARGAELKRIRQGQPPAPDERERVSKEAAAEILAAAGFRPKSFNEAAE